MLPRSYFRSALAYSARAVAFRPAVSRSFTTSTALWNQTKQGSAQAAPAPSQTQTQELPSYLARPKNSFSQLKVSEEELLPLKLGGALYATVHIHDRKFLVTEGDEIVIPVRLRDAAVGDVLEFSNVSTIGTREHTLTGAPAIDPSIFSIKGVVIEKTREPRRVHERTQRRVRHVRHVVTKNCITVIRVSELKLN